MVTLSSTLRTPYRGNSIFRAANSIPRERIDAKWLELEEVMAREYQKMAPGKDFVIRNLQPQDFGETNNIWNETVTATQNAYENSIIASQNIPDNSLVGIIGLIDTSENQPVLAVRISGGNSRRAQWDLWCIVSDERTLDARTGYAETPVLITQNLNVTIQYYVRASNPAAIQSAGIAFLGLVAEPNTTSFEL